MNIAGTQYSLQYNAYEIYLSGCDGACKGCHNSSLFDFNFGEDYKLVLPRIKDLLSVYEDKDCLRLKWIWILGGEPLLQNRYHFLDLLSYVKQLRYPIVLFTRFSLESIPRCVLDSVDFVKSGGYDETKLDNSYYQCGIRLASRNQKIYIKSKDY